MKQGLPKNWLPLIILLFTLVASHLASSATISGTVYDLSLSRVLNAAIEINTTPNQLFVAREGLYSFNVPPGSYVISTTILSREGMEASAAENITVNQDGRYIIDLILFDEIGEEDIGEIIDNGVIEEIAGNQPRQYILPGIISVVAIAGALLFFWKRKDIIFKSSGHDIGKQNIEEEKGTYPGAKTDLTALVALIKKEGGRMTQKELRKQMPLSEAKISLMITELEHKGIVEKIKKGRGNVVILKK